MASVETDTDSAFVLDLIYDGAQFIEMTADRISLAWHCLNHWKYHTIVDEIQLHNNYIIMITSEFEDPEI